ncbi:MAG: hypothetical protein GY848_03865 [Methyloversatilis sp.]|jgi:hypothetical protein|uniref:Uncharacterized protein n=1 Tax=Methyloversatilis universalis (strain ATCC BAA-1314 / DSM 25237 / JCM 13912 / CCUG 52030 / FAM5) TaxID=1000565 RepID=F5RA97_METUF|nr:hypothetical protein [Methyloversatilis universalis]EGK72413.1 hypothetical protein METUNv1_01177 [Methyloversatilis universalis FAM5]MCP4635596.1 hypothetical protein [Methyloversatilis sp.]
MKCAELAGSRLYGLIAGSCVGAALFASLPVLAGEPGGRRDFAEPQRLERVIPAGATMQPMRRFDEDSGPVRRLDYGDPRSSRMTPEERRQLRRDIRDAARELYRDAPGP